MDSVWIILQSRFFMYIVLAMLLVSGLIGGCSLINQRLGLKDDNLIEEAIEQELKDRTGVELDLSPGSKEQ